jgi:SPP1 gp7 family putative phage head morphogenesis protein
MYTNEELEKLEQEQYELSMEHLVLIVALLLGCRTDIKKEILAFYEQYGTNGVVNYRTSRKKIGGNDHRKRVSVLYSKIDDILDDYFLDIEARFRGSLIDIIKSEIDFFDTEIDVDEIINFKWGSDHKNWNTRLWEHKDKWSNVIKKDLKIGFLRGDNVEDVLENIYDRFKSAEKAMKSLHTTEYNAMESETRYRIFKELGIKEYQYYATVDERTCPTCGELHGLVFPMTAFEIGVTVPPIHPNCRCFIVPIK